MSVMNCGANVSSISLVLVSYAMGITAPPFAMHVPIHTTIPDVYHHSSTRRRFLTPLQHDPNRTGTTWKPLRKR